MPLDELLLDLINGVTSSVTAQKKQDLLNHIAGAPFRTTVRSLLEWAPNSSTYVGLPHPTNPSQVLSPTTRLSSLEYHVVKHTVTGEWPRGTDPGEYLRDVQSAAKESGYLHVGNDDGLNRAGTCPDVQAVKAPLKVNRPPNYVLLTLYDPDRRWLVSGYLMRQDRVGRALKRWSKYRCL